MRSAEARRKTSETLRKYYKNHPEARKKKSDHWKKYWSNPDSREKQSETMKRWCSFSLNMDKRNLLLKKAMVSPEIREKISLNNRGEGNASWRGGIHTPYGPGFNRDLKEIILKRDDHLCQNPGCYLPENGRLHSIHHINFNKNDGDPINLITLCNRCHAKTIRGDRDHWQEYYQNLQEMRGISNV